MRLRTLISLKNEPYLEKWARFFRYTKADCVIREKIETKADLTLIDFGCGQDILYYKYLTHVFPALNTRLHYIGVDPLIDRKAGRKLNNVRLINKKFEKANLSQKADVITIFAVLEHVDNPVELLSAAAKLLKPDGVIVATTPSPLARYPLEFFSYVLGIIAKREIDEHQRYPDRSFILGMGVNLSQLHIAHEYFELGLNNLCLVTKKKMPPRPDYSLLPDLKLVLTVIKRAFRQV